jgi:glycosyltransferase involved in cell wall biosynthesis
LRPWAFGIGKTLQSPLEVREGPLAGVCLSDSGANRKPSDRRVLVVICAHNEVGSLPYLVQQLSSSEILVIDDGSTDGTGRAAELAGAHVLRHSQRLGKSASLARAIDYAIENRYNTIVEIGADAVPVESALEHLLSLLGPSDVGGVSLVQIPVGPANLAYHIDELIWSILAHGKRLQMAKYGDSHLGGVMFAFKPSCVSSVDGSVNDDEHVGECIRMSGFRTLFSDASQVFFDASSSIGHIRQRRQRMYFGHMMFERSTAPSMDTTVAASALFRSLLEKPSRLMAAVPALAIELVARLGAWRDTRSPKARQEYAHWVTTYAKNNSLLIRNRASR